MNAIAFLCRKVSESHGSEDIHVGLLGCKAVCTCKYIPKLWRKILQPSSGKVLRLLTSLHRGKT